MNIAICNARIRKHPITSISELCAVAGGVAKILLARFGSYGWSMLMTYIAAEIIYNPNFKVKADLILECIGAFGLVIIGTFYDDYSDESDIGMRTGHRIGVGLSLCTQIGFWVQRAEDDWKYIYIPIIILIIFIPFAVLFIKCPVPCSDDPKEVTKLSIRTVIFEAIALAMNGISIVLFFAMR